MVAGINVNNYSAAQLQELKNAGMSSITDADIKAAQEREAQASADKASDESQMQYTISDDAGEVNEAEQEVKTAEEYGANLKTILGNLISKCSDKNSEMAKLDAEMQQFVVTMEDLGMQAQVLESETEQQVKEAEAKVDEKVKDIEEKKAELDEQVAVAKTSTDEVDVNRAAEKAEALGTEITQGSADLDKLQAQIKSQIQQTAVAKATLLGNSMEDVKNMAESNANEAINANEYADVTIDKGMEASSISSKKEAKAAGFKKRGGFFGLSKKGDVKAAHKMGDTAIATGSQLGNSSKGVAQTINTVGQQFGMNFAETSKIGDIANKEYVDTSKMDELTNIADVKGFKNKRKAAKQNAGIISDIASAYKESQGVNNDDNKKKTPVIGGLASTLAAMVDD